MDASGDAGGHHRELAHAALALLDMAAAWLQVTGEETMPPTWPESAADWAVDHVYELVHHLGGRPLERIIAHGALHSVGAGTGGSGATQRLQAAAEVLKDQFGIATGA